MTDIVRLLPDGLRESFEIGGLPAVDALPALTAGGKANPDLVRSIEATNFPASVRSGLLLVAEADDVSHAVSQSREGDADCDYWHGIMHRREPDYGNAGYWFRRVGRHPAMDDLPAAAKDAADAFGVQSEASTLLTDAWDPSAMIDLCRLAEASPESDLHTFCRAVQWLEMRSLLRHCLLCD